MAETFSSGGAVLTSRTVSGSCISASAVGEGQFRTLLKCSAHLASTSASDVRVRPCLSVISVSIALCYLPQTILVIL